MDINLKEFGLEISKEEFTDNIFVIYRKRSTPNHRLLRYIFSSVFCFKVHLFDNRICHFSMSRSLDATLGFKSFTIVVVFAIFGFLVFSCFLI